MREAQLIYSSAQIKCSEINMKAQDLLNLVEFNKYGKKPPVHKEEPPKKKKPQDYRIGDMVTIPHREELLERGYKHDESDDDGPVLSKGEGGRHDWSVVSLGDCGGTRKITGINVTEDRVRFRLAKWLIDSEDVT